MRTAQQLRDLVDRGIVHAMRKEPSTPCSKGCFHCCREPVYADRSEVKDILASLTAAQIEDLKPKLKTWLSGFAVNGFGDIKEPNAFKYRTCFLWCPLLAKDGTCSVYERRPIACRLHIAKDAPINCQDDSLRPHQKFALIPELSKLIGKTTIGSMEEGESLDMDHLCILLSEEVFGEAMKTQARIEVRMGAEETATIASYGES